MSGGSKEQTVGYRYYLGMHMGVCEGPVDAVHELRAGDRTAWRGVVTASGSITVAAEDLFGGDDREGGVSGTIDVMMGDAAQASNAYLSTKQGTPQPAYRGLLSLVLKQVYLGANNPYIKPWAILAKRIVKNWTIGAAWYPEKAAITVGELIEAEFAEDFSAWPQAYHTLIDPDFFVPTSTPYGTGMQVINVSDTTVDGQAIRTIPAAQYGTIRFKGRVDINVPGDQSQDADIVFVIFGAAGGGTGITVVLSRDATGTGSNERPEINGVAVGTAPLVVGTWYQFDFALNWSTSVATYTITNLSTSVVFASGTTSFTVATIDKFELGSDIAPNERIGDAGTVADIRLERRVPLQGMNPAHIIYECLTNTEWGMGNGAALINDTSFRSAADVFYTEGLGLCLHWSKQEQIERFGQVVMDHAGAVLVQHPRTGLFELRPLRGGYDPLTLPLYDESSVRSLESFERPSLAEATNEVTVAFNDVAHARKGSVTVQNLANITAQGGVVARSTAYPGLPNSDLARRTAMRDLQAVSTPLARARFTINRTAYLLLPGDLVRLNWAKRGVTNLVLRVLSVRSGTPQDGTIEIDAAEDIFGLPAATYAAEQPSSWSDPATPPAAASIRLVREATYYELQRALGASAAKALPLTAGYVVAAASRPSQDSIDVGMWTRTGAEAFAERGARGSFAPSAALSATLAPGATTATLTSMLDVDLVEVGSYAQIEAEIVRVDAINAITGAVTFGRGCLGTVAKSHAASAKVVFVDQFVTEDPTERLDGEVVDVRLTPRTGRGALNVGVAPTDSVTLDQIATRPYAPGQMRINGATYPITVTNFTVTWAHRDRLAQNLEGDESGNIGPEAGTSYSLEVRKVSGGDALLHSATAIAVTSYTPPVVGDLDVRLLLWSVRADPALLALSSAFAVTRKLAAIGAPSIYWRWLLPAGGYVQVTSSVSTIAGAIFTVERYSALGALLASENAFRVSSAAFDESANKLGVGVYSLAGDLTQTASKVWIYDLAVAGLSKVQVTPAFPPPSGIEIIGVAAGGGSVYAVNYASTRLIRYNGAGTQQASLDATGMTQIDCDGASLVHPIAGGFKKRHLSTLASIGDVTFAPSVTRLGQVRLIGGEVVFLGDPSSGNDRTLYRYALDGTQVASYAGVPFSAANAPVDMQAFGRYLSAGDTGVPKVFDMLASWAVVPPANAPVALDSAQKHDHQFRLTAPVPGATLLGSVSLVAGSASAGAPWNSADKDADVSLSSGDTVASITSPAQGSVRGVTGRAATGHWYFEITVGGADGRSMVGIGLSTADISRYPGFDTNGRGYWGDTGQKYVSAGASTYGAAFAAGDVIGVQLNNGTLTFWKNGTSQGAAFTGLTGTWYPMWSGETGVSGTRTGTLASGSFAFGPPSGASAWG